MLINIVLDLDPAAWSSQDSDAFNALNIYVRAATLCSPGTTVRIINSCRVIWDSAAHGAATAQNSLGSVHDRIYNHLQPVVDFVKRSDGSSLTIGPNDIGYALMQKPTSVFVYSLSPEAPSAYLRYAKCLFAAQELGIRIDAYCPESSISVRMCSRGTGGLCLQSGRREELLRLLGHIRPGIEVFRAQCSCCSREVRIAQICPICLAIYCKFVPVCRQCKTKFIF
ncbi:transcription initiation factor TFIIH subunit 3 [Pancytospora philotis]|nr:transcription initiation factor TFIIH subunit 3 [Pancytospora philotis]